MVIVDRVAIRKNGGSYIFTVPSDVVKAFGIKEGDEVPFLFTSALCIFPPNMISEKDRENLILDINSFVGIMSRGVESNEQT